MSATVRLLSLVFANFVIVAVMLTRLSSLGIDIENTRLIDNTGNLSFMFDFVSFLIVSFMVNVGILTANSGKRATIERIISILEQRNPTQETVKRHRKQSA